MNREGWRPVHYCVRNVSPESTPVTGRQASEPLRILLKRLHSGRLRGFFH
jgi:hypothetical protein